SKAITLENEELASEITTLIGGAANITSIGACITRLRLQIKDQSLVNEEGIKDLGAMGVIKVGSSGLQIILGARAQFVAEIMSDSLSDTSASLSVSPS
ncbi:PTS glucose/sucrose transporter subunit IIB, partial [Vibrio sinaloensis]